MKFENALVSRRIAHETDEQVTIIEVWDTSHPDSPWVTFWPIERPRINPYVRAVKLTRTQYGDAKMPLKP